MAVPDTDDFTLQNVVTEVNPTTNDLVDCFADADSAKFDSSYSGTKNQLLNFRNYGAAGCSGYDFANNKAALLSAISDWDTDRSGAIGLYGQIQTWCVGAITDMSELFKPAGQLSPQFNSDISNWDVSSVTTMQGMFQNNTAFNQDISAWDVSNVINMASMFTNSTVNTTSYNQPLNAWDVSSVTNMNGMFASTDAFDQPLNLWDVSSVTNMTFMFFDTTAFDQSLNSWDVSSVTLMSGMFQQSTAFNGNISSWVPSSVVNMSSMFAAASAFNQSLNSWNVTSVINFSNMFNQASIFNGNITSWDPSSAEDMGLMFSSQGTDVFNQDINGWDVSSVTTMQGMFLGSTSFDKSLNSWNVGSVTNMQAMFEGATAFNGNISSWDVGSVTNMVRMFEDATTFNQNISIWCVNQIISEPFNFSTNSPLTAANKPQWGTCYVQFNTSLNSPGGACLAPQTTPLFYDGFGGSLAVNDNVYSDRVGTLLNNTTTTNYYIAGTNAYAVRLGVVTSITACTTGGGNSNIILTDCVTGQQYSIDPGSFAVAPPGATYRYTRTGSGTVYCGTVTRNPNSLPGLKEGDIIDGTVYTCGDTANCPTGGGNTNLLYFVVNNTGTNKTYSYTNSLGTVVFDTLIGFAGDYACAQENTVVVPAGVSFSTDGTTCS